MKKLEQYIAKGAAGLRLGYTTGSCAAAAAGAAADMLLGGEPVDSVKLRTPAGLLLTLDIEKTHIEKDFVSCAVQKDAGDDPDATDSIFVHARVRKLPSGIEIDGGEGVGRVTLPGLACEVGKAAINPAPLGMIRAELAAACEKHGYTGGLSAVIFVPEGKLIAKNTFNARLGITGGISILGTTGIVEPMSETALLGSIHAEMDQKHALGVKNLLIVPGNYGRDFARETFGLSVSEGVACSNFIGKTLDYAVYKGFEKILLAGHAGKLIKLAAGIMNTHSSVADGRAEIIAAHAALQGITTAQAQSLMGCVTVDAADELLRTWGIAEPVWESIGEKIQFHLNARLKGSMEAAFAAFCKNGVIMGSNNLETVLHYFNRA